MHEPSPLYKLTVADTISKVSTQELKQLLVRAREAQGMYAVLVEAVEAELKERKE